MPPRRGWGVIWVTDSTMMPRLTALNRRRRRRCWRDDLILDGKGRMGFPQTVRTEP